MEAHLATGEAMSQRFFGTDGLRGRVNVWPLTADMALRLGLAAGTLFRDGERRHTVIIGKDTRLSGYMFETALTAGLCALHFLQNNVHNHQK